MEELRDAGEQIESIAPSIPKVRREAADLMSRAEEYIRKFPMSSVLTAMAGGFLIGMSLARRRSESMPEMYVTKPLRRGGKLLSAMLAAAADAGRDRAEQARSALRMPDVSSLGREAKKWARKVQS